MTRKRGLLLVLLLLLGWSCNPALGGLADNGAGESSPTPKTKVFPIGLRYRQQILDSLALLPLVTYDLSGGADPTTPDPVVSPHPDRAAVWPTLDPIYRFMNLRL
jgi:hypothetical protein